MGKKESYVASVVIVMAIAVMTFLPVTATAEGLWSKKTSCGRALCGPGGL